MTPEAAMVISDRRDTGNAVISRLSSDVFMSMTRHPVPIS
jgi:hypothetical protein